MEISEAVDINAPLPVVWQVFSQLENWDRIKVPCTQCCYVSGDRMAVDTCFTFSIRPLYFPLKVQPKIVKCDPARVVVWKGSRLGVRAVHTFQFIERNGRVTLKSVETFQGAMVTLSRLFGVPQRLHRITQKFLAAIKKEAESCARGATA